MFKILNYKNSFYGFQKFKKVLYSTHSEINIKKEAIRSNFEKRRKVMDFSPEIKLLRSVYPSMVNELLNEQLIYFQNRSDGPEIRKRYKHLIDYTTNLDDTYLSTAALIVRGYKLLEKPSFLNEENLKRACILGWCLRLMESAMIILDDIIDNTDFRYDKPVWFKLPNVGINTAIMDATVMKSNVTHLLLNHLGSHPQYLNIHRQITRCYASVGISTALELPLYKLHEFEKCDNIVKAYPFTVHVIFPIMFLANIVDQRFYSISEQILMDFAEYLKALDDIEGLSGKSGKHCTDVELGRITWMSKQVAKRGTDEQKNILQENFGKTDKEAVSKIYEIYENMHLKEEFELYKEEVYEDIYKRIENLPNGLTELFLDLLDFGIDNGIRS